MGLIAIDPGAKVCGFAYFERETLTRARVLRAVDLREMAYEIRCNTVNIKAHFVIERPQVYVRGKSKGDPNDLITIALVAGMVAGATSQSFEYVLPREWKGQVPKAVHSLRIEKKLSQKEIERIEKCPASIRHNAIDAIGIGLWKLGRL